MNKDQEDALRGTIAGRLSGGLATTTEPVPADGEEFDAIVRDLREVPRDDVERKLVISGFVDHPQGEEGRRCLECMYYRVHRKWCALPAIGLPVEPEWWCRLWRI
ncbi:MAG TPA: hypothetical protein VGM06_26275 [Polyangiaceae bacterium]|jgi:hypothetical protein